MCSDSFLMLAWKLLLCLALAVRAVIAVSPSESILFRPPEAFPDPECASTLNITLYNASSWLSDRVVDVEHTRSDRICNRYEDDSVRHSSHVAKSKLSKRCSHSLLVGRLFCGQLDWEAPTQGHIYYHFSSGHYSYEPDLCVLRRLGRDEAQACMADVGPVLFAGDSVTRYQFLTFAHFLASGKYQHPFNGSKSLSSSHAHRSARGSNRFEELWAHAKDQVEAHGRGSGGGLYYNHDRAKGLEHAHLTLPLRSHDGSRKAHLYYCYLADGLEDIKGVITWAMSKRQDWRYLIINVCSHYGKDYLSAISRHVVSAVEWANMTYGKAFAKAHTQLVWRSCTTPHASLRETLDEQEGNIAEFAASAGVPIFDTRSVIKAAMDQHLVTTWKIDTVHYLQFMYEQWNDLLLNILCPDADSPPGRGDAG